MSSHALGSSSQSSWSSGARERRMRPSMSRLGTLAQQSLATLLPAPRGRCCFARTLRATHTVAAAGRLADSAPAAPAEPPHAPGTTAARDDTSGAADGPCQQGAAESAASPPRRGWPSPAKHKRRLDAVVEERFPGRPPAELRALIAQGRVTVDGVPVDKAGTPVAAAAVVAVTGPPAPRFVCRAGLKLEYALEHFGVDVTGLTALDAGVSTGGFTDCLLQRGVRRVYGVDVGYGQVAHRVRTDPRVTLLERTNLRLLGALPGGDVADIATLDLSFISLLTVLPAVGALLRPRGRILALIKPQFEARREQVSRGGLVADPAVHAQVLARVTAGMTAAGFAPLGAVTSPIEGATAGNTEFLALFERGG